MPSEPKEPPDPFRKLEDSRLRSGPNWGGHLDGYACRAVEIETRAEEEGIRARESMSGERSLGRV